MWPDLEAWWWFLAGTLFLVVHFAGPAIHWRIISLWRYGRVSAYEKDRDDLRFPWVKAALGFAFGFVLLVLLLPGFVSVMRYVVAFSLALWVWAGNDVSFIEAYEHFISSFSGSGESAQ